MWSEQVATVSHLPIIPLASTSWPHSFPPCLPWQAGSVTVGSPTQ